jgi:hypothetical protein
VHAEVIELGPLGLEEFQAAQRVLGGNKIQFQRGAEYAAASLAPQYAILDDRARPYPRSLG